VQTHQINVSRASDMVREIRHELFAFPEVLEVFVTGRPDWLVVVSRGRPRPGEWLRALRAVGYNVPVRRRSPQAAEPAEAAQAAHADRQGAAAPASIPAPGLPREPAAECSSPRRAIAVLASTLPAGPPWPVPSPRKDRELGRRAG
jgi:hypothetical protein